MAADRRSPVCRRHAQPSLHHTHSANSSLSWMHHRHWQRRCVTAAHISHDTSQRLSTISARSCNVPVDDIDDTGAAITPTLKTQGQTVVHAFISSRLDYCNSLYMASPTIRSGVCRQCKTQHHAWLAALEDVITLHRSCVSYIGYQCDSGWNSSSLSWSSRLSTTWHHMTLR